MSHIYELAATRIMDWFHRAEKDLIGQTVTTFNGEAGECYDIKLDEHHVLCFTIDPPDRHVVLFGPRRWFPVSTIRHRT